MSIDFDREASSRHTGHHHTGQQESSHHTHASSHDTEILLSRSGGEAYRMLLSDAELDIREGREREAYNMLRERHFQHTWVLDDELLTETGMSYDFPTVWNAVEWHDITTIPERGSRYLTLQFLCTLQHGDRGISFRLFHRNYEITWAELSTTLGFHPRCALSLDHATRHCNRDDFWKSISGRNRFTQPRTNHIHNPTLRLMHKWMAMTLFPRQDLRPIRIDELKLLFAMVRKIKVSPVVAMINQWIEDIRFTGTVSCTSLVTRIADRVGALCWRSLA